MLDAIDVDIGVEPLTALKKCPELLLMGEGGPESIEFSPLVITMLPLLVVLAASSDNEYGESEPKKGVCLLKLAPIEDAGSGKPVRPNPLCSTSSK